MFTVSALSELLQISSSTLNRMRVEGKGPRYTKAGRRVLYSPKNLHAWLEANERQSTSDNVGGGLNG